MRQPRRNAHAAIGAPGDLLVRETGRHRPIAVARFEPATRRGDSACGGASRPAPILALAPNAWDGQWMNRQQLLSRLAAHGRRVVYSTGQWASWHRRDPEWWWAPARGAFELRDGVWVDRAPRWLLRVPRFRRLDALSVRLAAQRLQRFACAAGGDGLVLHVFHPRFQPYAEAMRPARMVYHAYDLYELMPGWTRRFDEWERWLLARADLRIAASRVAAARLEERGGRSVRVLPNGVDFAAFHAAADDGDAPADLQALPAGPRLGYVGSLNRKLDLPLIAELASTHPHWQFVLIGRVGSLDDATTAAMERCRRLANVHELGWKSRTEVPAYVANLDVALMPYRVHSGLWTDGMCPLKLHEYLAAGRPVVGSDVPALGEFTDVVSIADSPAQWADAIGRALADDAAEARGRRLAVARGHDWSTQAATLREWIAALGA